MKISQHGIDLIRGFEGLELSAYLDQGNVCTVGYGHTGPDVYLGRIVNEDEAEALLESDIAKAERALNSLLTVQLTQNEYDALVSFVFNVGVPKFQASTLLALLNKSDREGAAENILLWHHVHKEDNKGLMARRQQECDLFLEA